MEAPVSASMASPAQQREGMQTGGVAGRQPHPARSSDPGRTGAHRPKRCNPQGPHVQESLGHAGPAPTFEDLLSSPHDEDLFDYYATSQLAYLDSATGKMTPLGKPAIYTLVRPSPDQKHIGWSGYLHKPYSYQFPPALPGGNRGLGSRRESGIQSREPSPGRARSAGRCSHRPPLGRVASGKAGHCSHGWKPSTAAIQKKRPHPRHDTRHSPAPFSGEPAGNLSNRNAFVGCGRWPTAKRWLRISIERTRRPHARNRSRKARHRSARHLQPQ